MIYQTALKLLTVRRLKESVCVAGILAILSPFLSAQILYQEDFEGDTVGNAPGSLTLNSPASNTGAVDNPPAAGAGGPSGAVV
ncbi:MAG: hypothetical protein AAF558_13750, partial [Verrucomicrobiota bacterium]